MGYQAGNGERISMRSLRDLEFKWCVSGTMTEFLIPDQEICQNQEVSQAIRDWKLGSKKHQRTSPGFQNSRN